LYKLLKAQVGQKEKFNDRVSRDYCYLCVNIIRACDVCNKAVRHDMTVFQAIFRPQSWGL
jgi:hypothetical protein